jgi:hypothetical protein
MSVTARSGFSSYVFGGYSSRFAGFDSKTQQTRKLSRTTQLTQRVVARSETRETRPKAKSGWLPWIWQKAIRRGPRFTLWIPSSSRAYRGVAASGFYSGAVSRADVMKAVARVACYGSSPCGDAMGNVRTSPSLMRRPSQRPSGEASTHWSTPGSFASMKPTSRNVARCQR